MSSGTVAAQLPPRWMMSRTRRENNTSGSSRSCGTGSERSSVGTRGHPSACFRGNARYSTLIVVYLWDTLVDQPTGIACALLFCSLFQWSLFRGTQDNKRYSRTTLEAYCSDVMPSASSQSSLHKTPTILAMPVACAFHFVLHCKPSDGEDSVLA